MPRSIVTPQDMRDFATILRNNIDEFRSIKDSMDQKLSGYDWQDAVAVKFKSEYELTKGPIDKLTARMDEFINYLDGKAGGLESEYIGNAHGNSFGKTFAVAGAAVSVAAKTIKQTVDWVMDSVVKMTFTPDKSTIPTAKMTVPSVDNYYKKFKEKTCFYIDKDNKINVYQQEIIDAINEVHGNAPKVKKRKMEYYGQLQGGDTIAINELLSDSGMFVETYAHENQHIDQREYCADGKNDETKICKNMKDYSHTCTSNQRINNPLSCSQQDADYYNQPMEVNARAAGENAKKAFKQCFEEYKNNIKYQNTLDKIRKK